MTNSSDVSVGYSEIGKGVDHFLWDTKYLEQSFWAHCFRRTKSRGNGVAKSLGKKKRPSLWPTALEWARNSISVMSRQPRTQPVALDAAEQDLRHHPASSIEPSANIVLYPPGGAQLIPTESPWQGWEVPQLPRAPCQREELPGTGTLPEATLWSKLRAQLSPLFLQTSCPFTFSSTVLCLLSRSHTLTRL